MRNIEIFDTGIAFLAGLMIVPAVFVFSGGDQASLKAGPTLMFITLPKVFDSMAGGHLIGTVFFVPGIVCCTDIVHFPDGDSGFHFRG